MGNRSRRPVAVVAIVAMLVGLVSALTGASPAAAANQPFTLDLVEGELLIRDAEEALVLEQPTVITGQHDTGLDGDGAVSGGTFTSPTISFETEALGQPVFVDATFSQVTPGSGTGSIDSDGNVSFRTSITVDLHIEVNNPPVLVQECQATPVNIALDSVTPWNPETRQVTLRDADFTVPAVVASEPDCISLVAGNVNELLAGSGHSLTMTMEGDLVLPEPAGCPTATTLEVSPAETFLGDAVTLDATVVGDPDDSPECIEANGAVPTGTVEFLANGTQIGVAELDGTGKAQLVSSALPTGTHDLTARYRRVAPYSSSESAAVSHSVFARPTVSIDAPSAFTIGAPPVEFEVELSNSGAGRDVENGRLDVTLTGGDSLTAVTLERWDGDSWEPVPLTSFAFQVYGEAQPSGGVALPAGSTLTERYRMSVANGQTSTPVDVTFELVPVDPEGSPPAAVRAPAPDALARATVDTLFTTVPRRDPVMNLNTLPHTLRQGMVVQAQTLLQPAVGGLNPTGTYTVLLDGKPVPVRGQRTPPEFGYQPTMPVRDDVGTLSPKFVLPPDTQIGTRQVTVKYSGDAFYKPAQRTSTITVLPSRGVIFECTTASIFFTDQFNVHVDVSGNLPPAVRPGESVSINQLDVEIYADRGDATSWGSFFGPSNPVVTPESGLDGFTVADLKFGALGTAQPSEVTFANNFQMDDSTRPVDPAPDMEVGFVGEEADLTFTGAPGTVVPVALDGIELSARFFGGAFTLPLSCVPMDEPAVFRDVTIAGTGLTVSAPEPTREGDAVTLTASVAPVGTPGTVEFRDGSTTLAVVPVASTGVAVHQTTALEAGEHSLTARFTAASAGINSVSAAVPLTVLEEFDCGAFTDEGAGRTVRWGYLVVLDRCPFAGEYEYWVGRLEGGTSQATFARSISRSLEAYRVQASDVYSDLLDRPGDDGGLDFWSERLKNGYRIDRMMAAMAGSPEFFTLAGSTNEGFVTRLYETILHRAPEPAGLDYWVGQLEAGVQRWKVAQQFSGTPEVRIRLVRDAYDRALDRVPTPTELADATAGLKANGDLGKVNEAIVAGAEFADVAQDLPNLLT